MTHVTGAGPKQRRGRRFVVVAIAVVAVAMLGAVLTLAGSTVAAPTAQAQIASTTCYTINDGAGTMTSWTGGVQANLGTTGLSQVEALAANQDRNELWTFDNNTRQIYTFVPGSAIPTSQFAFITGDIDGLTWVNHTDGDITNDELWATYRNPVPNVDNSPNEADQIVRIAIEGTNTDPEGQGTVVSGPTNITDPAPNTSNEQDDNDGLIWDSQSNNMFGVIGGDSTTNELIIIDPTNGSITQLGLTLNGGDIFDIESLGAGTDGQLYGTTGEDGVDANKFISINKLTGVVTEIGTYGTILDGGLNVNVDYEATACLTEVPAPAIATIGNFIWRDNDRDGIQDLGEPEIEGVTVTVWSVDDAGELGSIVSPVDFATDALGQWSLNVSPGDYRVAVALPPLAESFSPRDGGDDALDSDVIVSGADSGFTNIYTIANGDNNLTIDAGIVFAVPAIGLAKDLSDGPTRIGQTDDYEVSYTFVIENLGETALTGVMLTDNVAVGLAGTTGSVLTGPTPDAGVGTCSAEVAAGTQALAVGESCTAVWHFVITNPSGAELAFNNSALVQGTPLAGGPPVTDISDEGGETDTDGDNNGDEPGENDPTPTLISALASLGDIVFEDTDGNGLQDVGEPGVGGVNVNLLDAAGNSTGRFVSTAADGSYSFDDLDAGTYIVQFIEPVDRDFTTQDAGDDTFDSDAGLTTGQTSPIILAPGDNDPTVDAGLTPLSFPVGSISNLVFDDLDGNGIQDVGEPGLAGVAVALFDGAGNSVPGVDPVVTDGGGNYIFGDLPVGAYIVAFTAPDGRNFSLAHVGNGTNDSDAGVDGRTGVITLGVSENNTDVDAGIAPLISAIGLAKALVGEPVQDSDGNYKITYSFVIENLGETPLSNVGITDDFSATFNGATFDGPTPLSGTCDVATVVNGTASLAVGESCTEVWSVTVEDLIPGGTYNNTAIVTGTSPLGEKVTDISDEGNVPDGDGDGDADEPGENDPTLVTMPLVDKARLGDKVFLDKNYDGIQDPDEAPVAGAVVRLFEANADGTKGALVGQQTTPADGTYLFD
ncbi:MAG: putative repeat protein (TIGR01451 family), partial [Acidimicrobiales bacterium]